MSKHPEILEYKEMAEEMRLQLENEFSFNMLQQDKVSAHNTFKKLMEYGLVSRDDPRASTKTRMFSGDDGVNVKDPTNYGLFDYRRKDSLGYIPRYLFCNIGNYTMFNVTTLPHWGKRVEGNYSGDIKIGSGNHRIKLIQENYFVPARKSLEEVGKIFSDRGKKFPGMETMKELLEAGVVRILRIEVQTEVIYRYKILGYVLLKMNNNGDMVAQTAIRYGSLHDTWMNVREFMANLESAIREIVSEEVIIGHLFDLGEAIETQDSLVKIDNAKDKSHEELVKKEEEQKKAKQAEKEAKEAEKMIKENERLAKKMLKLKSVGVE